MAFAVDPGTPLPAYPAGAEQGLALHTSVCPASGCTSLHLRATQVRDGGDTVRATVVDGAELFFEFEVERGQLEGADERARAWLASERGAWLSTWIADNAALLRGRFERLKAQAADEPADVRPAPAWKPTARVLHRELYPHDFAPMVRHDGKPWVIVDACCPDPACTCTEVVLGFFSLDGASTEVVGELGERRPTKASALGKALWNAIHDEPKLLDRLVERRDDIRHWGPFIVGAAYEKVRLARRASGAAADAPSKDDGGYLQGGAIPEALVRRLFDAAERLHAARSAIETAWWSTFRVEIRGAITREAWAAVADDPTTVALFDAPEDDVPWLDLTLAPRDEASLEMRRQRCALGLPLLGGASLPIVERARPEGTFGPPSADDVRLVVAVVEALLAAPREEIVGASTAPRVLEHRVELDAGALDVRLTASHAEHPWTEEDVEDGGDPDLPDEGDDLDDLDDEDEDTFTLTADPLVEAFTDAAIDRGLARDVVITARVLLDAIAGFASEEGTVFFDERTWAAFLSDYAPRKMLLDEGDIARAPAALRTVADWLAEVGHVEPRRFRASLDRALPSFQQRARDPRRFSMAKALFAEMRTAGVDLGDQTAIDRFLAVKNAAPPHPLSSNPITTAAAAPNPASVSRSPTRWSPAPGERWPAPTDPCGCGSGRRFKKCCMPR